jgi:hypothetical protein
MHPPVVAYLMARVANLTYKVRIRQRRMSGNEEGAPDVVSFKQREDARHRDRRELAARNRRRIIGASDPYRHGVEVKTKTCGQPTA